MADSYRVVLAVAAEGSMTSWDELTRSVLPTAFRNSGLDWRQADYIRSAPGLLVAMPAATAGPLVKRFAQALADALFGPMRLGLGLAVGVCHRDDTGWYGYAVTTARRLAEIPSAEDEVRLAVSAAMVDITGDLGPHFTEVTDVGTSFWVRTTTVRQPIQVVAVPATASIAEVVHAVAAPVADFAEQLPILLSPDVAPADVLAWMYRTLGVDGPHLLDDRRGRRLLAGLMHCYRRRGTARGLIELIELRYGVSAEVIDPGGTICSVVPQTPVRQSAEPVTVLLDTDESLDGLDEVIRAALPVGVNYQVSRQRR